jgi:hypothetical protein
MLSIKNVIFLVTGIIILMLLPQFALAHGMSEADKLAIVEGGNLRYMWIGATHMLSGYDHLAFVFGIIFFLTTFRDIAKYVTAFTLGHSVTLIYATFNAIQLNYFAIDAVIGLSVCYIAFANIDGFRKYLNINPPNMLLMIAGLGLIHGFGLSTRLQELPLSEDSLLLNIISFNIGIELGQITALAVMLILISTWRKRNSFQTFSVVSNYGLILAGSLLFLMQMHGFTHISNPEEFIASAQASESVSASPPEAEAVVLAATDQSEWDETTIVTIPARGDKEFKFELKKNETLQYAWKTNGEKLFYDLHGDPKGDTSGYFKSFKKATESQSSGSFTTVFEGKHGWYWKNSSTTPVRIELKSKRYFNENTNSPQSAADKKTTSTTHDSLD